MFQPFPPLLPTGSFPASWPCPVLFCHPVFSQAILSFWCTLLPLLLSESLPILQCYLQSALKKKKLFLVFSVECEYIGIYQGKITPLFLSNLCSIQLCISSMQGLCFTYVISETLCLLLCTVHEDEIEFRKAKGLIQSSGMDWLSKLSVISHPLETIDEHNQSPDHASNLHRSNGSLHHGTTNHNLLLLI